MEIQWLYLYNGLLIGIWLDRKIANSDSFCKKKFLVRTLLLYSGVSNIELPKFPNRGKKDSCDNWKD